MTSDSSKKECLTLAQELASQHGLFNDVIVTISQLDATFFWRLLQAIFPQDILSPLHQFDCVNEIEQFQLILSLLSQVFELDLRHINPASLHIRNTQKLLFLLRSLQICGQNLNSKNLLAPSTELDLFPCFSQDKLTDEIASSNSDLSSLSSNEINLLTNESSLNQANKGLNKDGAHFLPRQLLADLSELSCGKQILQMLNEQKKSDFTIKLSFQLLDILDLHGKSRELQQNLVKLQSSPICSKKEQKKCKSQMFSSQFIQNSNQIAITNKTMQMNSKQMNNDKLNNDLSNNEQLNIKQSNDKKVQQVKEDSFEPIKKEPKKYKYNKAKKTPQTKSTKTDFKMKPFPSNKEIDALIENLSGLPISMVKKMRIQEAQLQNVIANLKLDQIHVQTRIKSHIQDQLEKEKVLHEAWMSSKTTVKDESLQKQRERAALRELRTHRAQLKRKLDEQQRLLRSHFLKLQSDQERLARNKFEQYIRETRDYAIDVRKQLKERDHNQKEQQTLMMENWTSKYGKQMCFSNHHSIQKRSWSVHNLFFTNLDLK